MKIVLFVLSFVFSLIYLYALRISSNTKTAMIQGFIEVGEERIPMSEIGTHGRIFTFFLFLLNIGVWLLCFVHFSHFLGALGCILAFCDFVANFETIARLASGPIEEKTANRIMALFYILIFGQLSCYVMLMMRILNLW